MTKIRCVPKGLFSDEAELCDHFSAIAKAADYTVHREVGTWDLLLVAPGCQTQIGIQAKLRAGVEVLSQALTAEQGPGPAVHAVLVPIGTSEFRIVANELRVRVFEGGLLTSGGKFPDFLRYAKRWNHPKPEWVPEVVVDVPAGVPAPRRVTRWKLAAVKLCLRLRERGYITPADMRELKLDRNWWFSPKFGPVLRAKVRVDEFGIERVCRGEYVFNDPLSLNNPDLRWPEIARALSVEKRGTPRIRTRPGLSSA